MERIDQHREKLRALHRATSVIEFLECRWLLASASIQGNVLVIEGNNATSDIITVSPSTGDTVTVKVNSEINFAFSLISFDGMLISGFGGSDNVTIDASIIKPATIRGGAGNDSLVGGSGNDLIDGGTDGDTIRG